MAKTGKRYEWEVGQRSGIPLMATIQDYDWADEVLHAAIGREWYIPQVGTLEGGARLRRPLLVEDPEQLGRRSSDRGLTDHENWWPAVYLQACEGWGVEPDPKVLAFAETYEDQRADLKTVSASG